MDQKPHMIDQKGLKMYKKRAKNRVFFYLKYLLFSGIRGYPPPLNEKNPDIIFCGLPKTPINGFLLVEG